MLVYKPYLLSFKLSHQLVASRPTLGIWDWPAVAEYLKARFPLIPIGQDDAIDELTLYVDIKTVNLVRMGTWKASRDLQNERHQQRIE